MNAITGLSKPGNSVAQWLIRLAARRAPAELAARLEEEWLADLGARRSIASRLGLALGCCHASVVIAREQARDAPQPTGVSPALLPLNTGVVTFHARNLHYFTLRPGTLFLIVGLQAALLCGLVIPL